MNAYNLFKIQKALSIIASIECNLLERTEEHTAQYIIDECVKNLNNLYKANIDRKEIA